MMCFQLAMREEKGKIRDSWERRNCSRWDFLASSQYELPLYIAEMDFSTLALQLTQASKTDSSGNNS